MRIEWTDRSSGKQYMTTSGIPNVGSRVDTPFGERQVVAVDLRFSIGKEFEVKVAMDWIKQWPPSFRLTEQDLIEEWGNKDRSDE